LLDDGGARDGCQGEVVDELRALANVVLVGVRFPSGSERDLFDGQFDQAQGYGRCNAVRVGDNGFDVHPVVVGWIRVGRDNGLVHYRDDVRGVEESETAGRIGLKCGQRLVGFDVKADGTAQHGDCRGDRTEET